MKRTTLLILSLVVLVNSLNYEFPKDWIFRLKSLEAERSRMEEFLDMKEDERMCALFEKDCSQVSCCDKTHICRCQKDLNATPATVSEVTNVHCQCELHQPRIRWWLGNLPQ